LAALEVLSREKLPAHVAKEAPFWEGLLHDNLADKPHVADVRNYGFAGALTLEPYPGEPMRRPFEVAMRMWEKGFLVRYGGDTIQLAPHFVMQREQMSSLVGALSDSLTELA
jgi:beta-alanine--pyruvate transaminase